MRNLPVLFATLFFSTTFFAQYRNDNVLYKTVYLEDLCNTLQQNNNYVLLDVRSKGEYQDTSQFPGLNIGHLKNAINIDINEMPARINELAAYRDRPIFVYCSHSQRSRRVSKMLADSGYAKVFNINGGVSSLQAYAIPLCNEIALQKSTPYDIVSPQTLLAGKNEYFMIDIRSDSVYDGITTDEKRKAAGKFNNVMHIPFDQFNRLTTNLHSGKNILLVDDFGNESPKAAQLLIDKGYKNVSVLFNGMDGFMQYRPAQNKSKVKWTTSVPYQILTAEAFDQMMKSKHPVLIDARPADEFNNQSKTTWRNVGRIKNAVNIPVAEMNANASGLPADKSALIIVYSFSSNNEVFDAAKKLTALGYKNVNVLSSGIFNLRWKAANLKGHEALKAYVDNIPAENL